MEQNVIYSKYLLESTNDTADRSKDIERMLNEHGVCILGSGVYYTTGIDMPDGSSLMGMGAASKLVLDPALESGYTVKIGSFCSVKDLSFIGAQETIELLEKVGERHGIIFSGNATTKEWHDQPQNSIITGCQIKSYNGGGITCVDTGYSTHSSLTATNCHIINCGACINISHFSEYHEFTNILCTESLYGCINNGGNNVFTNCGFNSNKTGYLIDNSEGQSNNNSHGSVVGCTFNHSDKNQGIGIILLGAQHGYVFTGCQMFYSKIVLENSSNIVFSSMNFGRNNDIIVKGGDLTMFSNCAFANPPILSIENNDLVKFVNCFTKHGEEIKA